MSFRRLRPGAALFLCALPAWSQSRVLTLDEALSLARDRGAGIALARGRVEEARAHQAQAGRRFQENPTAEIDGGYRRAESDFFDYEAVVTQSLYSSRRRSARLASARASIERAEAELAEVQRLLVRDVWIAFARILAAQDRAALLGKSSQAADALLRATQRRYDAGEGTALELNRARIAAASARAEQSAAEATAADSLAELTALLGLSEPVEIRGNLVPGSPPGLEALLAGIGRRADLRALAAELSEAETEILLGRALSRPEVSMRGAVAREERAHIATAGVVVTLPVHDRGQEALAVGEARAAALRQALAAARAAAEAKVRGEHAALGRRLAAVRELETTALPALEDDDALALKSFEAGEIGLGELLLIRRESLEAHLSYLDRLLEGSLTLLELESAAGALP
jgi:outer membrane protein, heavy metal efflux system